MMVLNTMVSLAIIIFMVKEIINGQTGEFLKEIGNLIKWMVKVYLLGAMEESLFIF